MLVVFLSSALVVAHSAMAGHDMGDAAVVCLAVAETAAGIAATATARGRPQTFAAILGPAWRIGECVFAPYTNAVCARAGPADTQVFRL